MNLDRLHQTLIAAARTVPPDDRVPLAFEKRITARLASSPVLDLRALWGRGLWRAALSCTALALLSCALTMFLPANRGHSNDLSQDFENTLLASVDNSADETP